MAEQEVLSADSALALPSIQTVQTVLGADKELPKAMRDALMQAITDTLKNGESTAALGAPTANHRSPEERKAAAVAQVLFSRYHFIRVHHSRHTLYYAKLPDPIPSDFSPLSLTHQPISELEFEELVTDIYLEMYHTATARNVGACTDTMKTYIREWIPKLENNVIEIAPGLYWNNDGHGITDSPTNVCLRRLFSTPEGHGGKNVLSFPASAFEEHTDVIRAQYQVTLSDLRNNEGDLPEDFEFVSTWADGDHDVYMDIMRMFATPLMKEKPFGSYLLIGNGRNGKSVCVGLAHTIFGTPNTSRVQLSDLDEWHVNLALADTMLNAPDEDEDIPLDKQSVFKTLSDHGPVDLKRMASQDPLTIQGDFMCLFPMNHLPKWSGTGAEACIRRSRIIPFNADLSSEDAKSSNFMRETFDPLTLSLFVGTILAIAEYYRTNSFPDSNVMKAQREHLEEQEASSVTYRRKLLKYFSGYTKLRFVYDDYARWAKVNDVKIQNFSEFSGVFSVFKKNRTTFTLKNGRTKQGYRIGKGDNLFYEGMYIPEADRTIEVIHERNDSVVDALERVYNKDENAQCELNLGGEDDG